MLYHYQRLWPYENSSIHPLLPLPTSLDVPSHLPWSPSILRKLNEWGWIRLGCTWRNCPAICHIYHIFSWVESIIESVFAQFLGGFNALMEHQTLWVSILDIIAVFGVAFGQENANVYAKSIESCDKRQLRKDNAHQQYLIFVLCLVLLNWVGLLPQKCYKYTSYMSCLKENSSAITVNHHPRSVHNRSKRIPRSIS